MMNQGRSARLTIKGVKVMVSEDFDTDTGTITTWVHEWSKSKKKWVWASCSTKPYEEVMEEMMAMS